MPRYIDADALLEKFDEYEPINWTGTEWENQMQSDYRFYRGLVESAPTADVVEVKHGEWIDDIRTFSVMDKFGYVREEQKKTHTCSLCRIAIVGLDNMRYCPNCGAKMDGGESE